MKYDRQAFVVYRNIKEKLPGGWGRPLVDGRIMRDTRPRTKSDMIQVQFGKRNCVYSLQGKMPCKNLGDNLTVNKKQSTITKMK